MGISVESTAIRRPEGRTRPAVQRQSFIGRRRPDATSALDRDFAAALPSGFLENFGVELEAQIRVDNSSSRVVNLAEAYDPLIETLNRDLPLRRQLANPFARSLNDPLFGPTNRSHATAEDLEGRIWAALGALREENPGALPDLPGSRGELLEAVREQAIAAERTALEVGARRTGGGAVGGFAGRMVGAVADPPNLVTIAFGAPASWGILRTAVFEALVGAGVETLIQPEVQAYREELGLEHGSDQALQNILYAGAGGGIFGGGLKAIGRALGSATPAAAAEDVAGSSRRELLERFDEVVTDPTPQQRAARQTAQDSLDIEDGSPLVDAPQEHLERLQVASDAIQTLDAPALTSRPEAPIAEASADNLEGVMFSFDPDELQVDADAFQFKSGADEAGVSDRLAGITQWDPAKAGVLVVWERADGTRFVADGHQRVALAQRLQLQDPAQRIRLFGVMLREADGVTVEQARAIAAAKNIAEGTGSAVDAAEVLRAGHEDATLPPQSPLVRAARDLTELSDDAFAMVVNELVPAHFAALVGRLVREPGQQVALLDLLSKTEPANVAEAEAIVRQALEVGFSRETTTDLFGEREIVESLFAERARVLDRSIKRLRGDRAVFNTLVREQDRIAGAGNVLRTAENQRRASTDAQALQTIQVLANRRGPLSDALTAAAGRAREEGRTTGAVADFVDAVRGAVARGDFDGIQTGATRRADEIAAEGRARAEQAAALDEVQAEPFDEPAGPAAKEQADQLQADVTDFLAADNLEADFDRLLDSRVEPAALIAHPLVQDAVDRMAAIPVTSELEGFGTPAYEAARRFTVNGRDVVGYDAAVDALYDMAARGHSVRQDRVAVLVSGPPASGKSAIGEPAAEELGARVIDPDDAKAIMPEFEGGLGANAVHEESAVLAARLLERALENGDNIVTPRTGGNFDFMVDMVEQLRDVGYKVFVYNMDIDPNIAFERMLRRFRRTGRLVNPDYALSVGSKPTDVYNQLRTGGRADGFKNFDNNGSGPRLLEAHGLEPGAAAAVADQGPRGGRASARDEGGQAGGQAAEGPGPEGGPQTELTARGEQVLIPGVSPVTDRDRLVMRAGQGLRGGDTAPAAGGLFDEGARAPQLFDTMAVDESIPIGELVDPDGTVVPRTATVRQLVDQLDDDQALVTVLQACAP